MKNLSLKFDSTIEKDIPVDADVITEEELVEEDKVFSDLYYGKLFSVVPKEHDLTLGMFPEDQGFHKRHIFAWANIRSLMQFSPDTWKRVSFTIPESVRFSSLIPLVGGAYGLPHVSNSWKLKEIADTELQDPTTY